MKLKSCIVFVLPLTLAACGGGSGGSGGSSGGTQAQESAAFVAPVQGEKRTYAQTISNIAGDTATYNVYAQIAQVNANASYTADWSEDDYVFAGGNYGSDPYTETYNAVGDVIASTELISQCTYTFPSGGRPAVMQPGQTWNATSTASCNSGPNTQTSTTTTTLSGTYLGVESINVPAGDYTAYKFQTTQTLSEGTVTITYWYDAASNDSRMVRELTQYQFNSSASVSDQFVTTYDMKLASY